MIISPLRPSPRFASRVASLSGSVARDILSRTQDREIVNFAGGLPDPTIWSDLELPPVPQSAFQYGPSEGEPGLRAILADLACGLGLPASPDRVLVTSGSQQGLDLASKLFLEPGTPILAESPTYLAALQVFQLFQANVQAIAVGPEGIDPEKLDRLLQASNAPIAYLNPTYQNPSGHCCSERRRSEIAEILDRREVALLEDDPYRDLYYGIEPPRPISSFLQRSPWIYLSSVSKTLLPGIRIGALHCSPELFAPLLKLKQAADLHTNRPAQFVAASLLADRIQHAQRLVELRARYAPKRDLLERALRRHLSKRATWSFPGGGMFFWLKLNNAAELRAVLERSLQRGVAFMPGDPFFADQSNHGQYVRLNFTSPADEKIDAGIETFARCLKELRGELAH